MLMIDSKRRKEWIEGKVPEEKKLYLFYESRCRDVLTIEPGIV